MAKTDHNYADIDWLYKRGPDSARQVYSIAHIVLSDDTEQEFMVKAAPSVTPHLIKSMNDTGFLTLWNDTDTLCIRAELIKHFSMRELTKE